MNRSQNRLTPDSLPRIPGARAWNIGFRTAHIGVTGVLLGGHVFDVSRERLHVWLWLSVCTGVVLIFLEAFPRLRWLHQARGVMVLVKMALLCAVPVLWDERVLLLAIIVVIASVGSHMPARFRYYSLLYRRVLDS